MIYRVALTLWQYRSVRVSLYVLAGWTVFAVWAV
jgi:hypothetical protein